MAQPQEQPSLVQPRLPKFLERNRQNAERLKNPPTMAAMRARTQVDSSASVILTCTDPRTAPEDFFGLERMDAPVIRNAGGRAADALRTLVTLHALVNLKNVVIVHHTDCGMAHLTDQGIREIETAKNPEAAAELKDMVFGCFREEDVDATVKEDIALLRASKALTDVNFAGFVLETETGLLREVEV